MFRGRASGVRYRVAAGTRLTMRSGLSGTMSTRAFSGANPRESEHSPMGQQFGDVRRPRMSVRSDQAE